ncbi:hypothetical protein PG996_004171 [Apiospora saccharicola]|uniref:Uncharacterized protein n=1 Tax=Apiospora saccharicola TaxID=335842 RepID=A0ABR1W3B8_9PEZI
MLCANGWFYLSAKETKNEDGNGDGGEKNQGQLPAEVKGDAKACDGGDDINGEIFQRHRRRCLELSNLPTRWVGWLQCSPESGEKRKTRSTTHEYKLGRRAGEPSDSPSLALRAETHQSRGSERQCGNCGAQPLFTIIMVADSSTFEKGCHRIRVRHAPASPAQRNRDPRREPEWGRGYLQSHQSSPPEADGLGSSLNRGEKGASPGTSPISGLPKAALSTPANQ